jgi:exodeoxyribonuclease-3
MRIATWNVNSIKAHLDQVSLWVKSEKPDVLCLQEIKCEDHAFPTPVFEELGYKCVVHGQKTYNGVAILSRFSIENVDKGLPGDVNDDHARFLAATILDGKKAVRVACLYLPNGNPAPGPKFDYKLGWMTRLREWAKREMANEEPLVLAGDFNVIPAGIDAKNPKAWEKDALFLPETRAAFDWLQYTGLTDAFRSLFPSEPGHYSFWDYQAGAWPKNNGIRIDHLLLSPQAADMLQGVRIHCDQRGQEKPSDHVPVEVILT